MNLDLANFGFDHLDSHRKTYFGGKIIRLAVYIAYQVNPTCINKLLGMVLYFYFLGNKPLRRTEGQSVVGESCVPRL